MPKIHKVNFATQFSFRPIFAAYRNPSFSLVKFLVPILAPLTTNEFSVTNSYEFTECILSVDNADKCFMVSFDVDSLFTN